MKIRRVLCATDFSAFSGDAVLHAREYARRHEAELTLLHVHPPMVPMAAEAAYPPAALPLEGPERERLLTELEASAAPARAAGVKVEPVLVEGDAATEILKQAAAKAADLVVMGTHGRRGFDRFILGSVANRVVHHARCPVLTVPRPPEGRPAPPPLADRILCPVELEGSDTILRAALDLARPAKARVTLLHVLEDLPQREAAARLAWVEWGTLQDEIEQDARCRLHDLAARCSEEGDQTVEVVVRGKAWREIVAVARALGVGLLVMGVHGRNAMERLFQGSTTAHVLRQAHCPVLTVRLPKAAAHS
jgi:nucleotide-binding universal stress UspA family protein